MYNTTPPPQLTATPLKAHIKQFRIFVISRPTIKKKQRGMPKAKEKKKNEKQNHTHTQFEETASETGMTRMLELSAGI